MTRDQIMSTRKLRSAGGAAFALTLTAGVVAILAEQAAVAADLTVTAPRQAELLSERVSTAGLDLGRDQDRRLLDRRLRAASARSLPLVRKLMSAGPARSSEAIAVTSTEGLPNSCPPKRSTSSPSRAAMPPPIADCRFPITDCRLPIPCLS